MGYLNLGTFSKHECFLTGLIIKDLVAWTKCLHGHSVQMYANHTHVCAYTCMYEIENQDLNIYSTYT